MTVPSVLLLIACVYFIVTSAYLALLSITAGFFKKTTNPEAAPLSFAVIVPAYNEEGQLHEVLDDLAIQKYPRDKYGVFVIADNCTDGTASLARGMGVEVFERTEPEAFGKGYALDWCLKNYEEELRAFDAIAIVDADARIQADFLEEMSASLSIPEIDCVQGYYGVANPEENWRTALTSIGFTLFNHVRGAGRDSLGFSSGINGSGMALRTSVLMEEGWSAHSIIEDHEFSLHLLLRGYRVRYNPDAVVVSDMPAKSIAANSQRTRWESGRLWLLYRYGPSLVRAGLTRRQWRFFEAALVLGIPPISMYVVLEALLVPVAFALNSKFLPFAALAVLATAFHVVYGLYLSHVSKRVWLYLFAAPLFVMWKFTLYFGMLLKRGQKEWVRTPRKEETENNSE